MTISIIIRALSLPLLFVALAFSSAAAQPDLYTVEFVATAATGVDMNNAGDVIGTSRLDTGCGSTCLPPEETVIWRNGERIVLPTVPGLSGITVTGINNNGWVVGFAGFLYTPTDAVVWKPVGDSYQAINLGDLPGKNVSTAIGIDDFNRVVGWSTTQNFPPVGAPFVWTESGGMVNLTSLGFPNEMPLGISPGGTVATYGYWYNLDNVGSATALTSPPSGFSVESSRVAINDNGDQARFLVDIGPQNLVYPFRYRPNGTWQQISFAGTGHLSTYGMGSVNEDFDVTVTVQGTAHIAFGPDGLAQPLAPLVSPAYGGSALTSAGRMNASGEILARMIIGQSQRVVRLVPSEPCLSGCIRVTSIQLKGRGPDYCDQGETQAKAKVVVTDENGNRLAGVTVTARFMDDYWLDEVLTARTNSNGQVAFMHTGPACVGAISILITGATSDPPRTLDGTTGILTAFVIPQSGLSAMEISGDDHEEQLIEESPPSSFGLSQNYPNPFNPSTTISYQLAASSHVKLIVSDMIGREVAVLVDGVKGAGIHSVEFDGKNLASGLYFYRLEAGGVVETKKLVLMK